MLHLRGREGGRREEEGGRERRREGEKENKRGRKEGEGREKEGRKGERERGRRKEGGEERGRTLHMYTHMHTHPQLATPTSNMLLIACSNASDCACSFSFISAIFSLSRLGIPFFFTSAESTVLLRALDMVDGRRLAGTPQHTGKGLLKKMTLQETPPQATEC